MPWNTNLINLRDLLADLYWDKTDARRIAQQAGLKVALIAFTDRPVNTWHNILNDALLRDKVQAVIDVARSEYPENKLLALAQAQSLTAVRGPDIGEQIQWLGKLNPSLVEKIIGKQSTLLPIAFLEMGLLKAQSVVRVLLANGDSGSGFLTANNLLITNHHVIANAGQAAQAILQFNYQKSLQGLDLPVQEYKLAPDEGFVTSSNNDWTAVRVQGNPNQLWGALLLEQVNPQIEEETIIIQHPGGGPKQIALYHNLITYVDQERVQYLTDTLPGSSGAPVFNSRWQLVALHHSGGWLREPGRQHDVYRNEGIHINVVINGLQAAGLL